MKRAQFLFALFCLGILLASAADIDVEEIQKDVYGRELASLLREDVKAKNFLQQLLAALDQQRGMIGTAISARVAYEVSTDQLLGEMGKHYAQHFTLDELQTLRRLFAIPGVRAFYYRVEDLGADPSQTELESVYKSFERRSPDAYQALVEFSATELSFKLRTTVRDAGVLRAKLMKEEVLRAVARAEMALSSAREEAQVGGR